MATGLGVPFRWMIVGSEDKRASDDRNPSSFGFGGVLSVVKESEHGRELNSSVEVIEDDDRLSGVSIPPFVGDIFIVNVVDIGVSFTSNGRLSNTGWTIKDEY